MMGQRYADRYRSAVTGSIGHLRDDGGEEAACARASSVYKGVVGGDGASGRRVLSIDYYSG